MTRGRHSDVTTLLERIRGGDHDAPAKLVELIYRELHQTAARLMRQERPDHTLQPTALLNEALLRLLQTEVLAQAPDRAYVFAAAARAMRQVLVEHARKRDAGKRGGDHQRLPLDAVLEYFEAQNVAVPALDEALEELAILHERQSQVVTLRFFGGLTVREVAEHLGVSVSTVEDDFRLARAWLRGRLRGEG